jgi:phage-related protein
VAFDEGKETVGSFVLDAITPMVNTFVRDVIPAIQKFAEVLGPKLEPVIKFLGSYIKDVLVPAFRSLWGFINDFLIPIFSAILTPAINGLRGAFEKVQKAIGDNTDELKPFFNVMKAVGEFARDTLAPIFGETLKFAFTVFGTVLSGLVTSFSKLVGFITSTINKLKQFVDFIKNNPLSQFFFGNNNMSFGSTGSTKTLLGVPTIRTGGKNGNDGLQEEQQILSFMTGGGNTNLDFKGDPRTFTGDPLEAFSPGMQAAILRKNELAAETARLRAAREAAAAARAGVTGGLSTAERINITVNGAMDAEGTARTIVETLNNSYFRGTGGASNLQAI